MEIQSSSGEEEGDNLEAICGTRWRVYWVSPLRNLQYTEARLKQYAMHLRGVLQSDSSVNRVDAKVAALPELRRHENAPIPLQISIEKIDGENKRQCVYNGIMLSWTEPRRPWQNNFVHLPLLLCRGGIGVTKTVHTTLQAFFDCSVIGLTFKTEDMLMVIGIAANYHNAELDDLHLKFNCPGLGENENFLDYTIEMKLLTEIWGRIHGPDQVDITRDEIMSLRDECYALLEEIYGFKVQMLQLIEIKWKGCLFSLNGYIKFSRQLGKVLLKYVEDLGYAGESSVTGMLNKREVES